MGFDPGYLYSPQTNSGAMGSGYASQPLPILTPNGAPPTPSSIHSSSPSPQEKPKRNRTSKPKVKTGCNSCKYAKPPPPGPPLPNSKRKLSSCKLNSVAELLLGPVG